MNDTRKTFTSLLTVATAILLLSGHLYNTPPLAQSRPRHQPALILRLDQDWVFGGEAITGTITLNMRPESMPVSITLSSENPAICGPVEVVISPHATSVRFRIPTVMVDEITAGSIQASLGVSLMGGGGFDRSVARFGSPEATSEARVILLPWQGVQPDGGGGGFDR